MIPTRVAAGGRPLCHLRAVRSLMPASRRGCCQRRLLAQFLHQKPHLLVLNHRLLPSMQRQSLAANREADPVFYS